MYDLMLDTVFGIVPLLLRVNDVLFDKTFNHFLFGWQTLAFL